METRQLVLITDEPSRTWRLDDHTRQVGLAGIAAARDALRTARADSAIGGDHPGHRDHPAPNDHPHAA